MAPGLKLWWGVDDAVVVSAPGLGATAKRERRNRRCHRRLYKMNPGPFRVMPLCKLKIFGVLTVVISLGGIAVAETPVHFLHNGVLATGSIGAMQLQRGGPLPGYYQPVEIHVPGGAAVSLACDGQFVDPQPGAVKAAMLVGSVYRFRVTGIPQRPGEEVYPTIEIINRLYPPIGEELKFPVPIELTQEDLQLALDGKFITRVIYLEDPRAAYAQQEDPKTQYTVEVSPRQDPLVMADRLGRPMAILRIGGRLPENVSQPDAEFLYHSPPLLRFRTSRTPLPVVGSTDGPALGLQERR